MKTKKVIKSGKMDWFILDKLEGKLPNLFYKSGYSKGCIFIPTGGGKTGHMFNHTDTTIDGYVGRKQIFNYSAPVLRLLSQIIGDSNDPIVVLHEDMVKNGEIYFFRNSSSKDTDYEDTDFGGDCYGFEDIDKFKNDPNAKIAIVASCHKSLPKFAEKIEDMMEYADVYTYIDECHLIIPELGEKSGKYSFSKEGICDWEMTLRKLCEGTGMFGVSATWRADIQSVINECAGLPKDHFIVHISANELIKKNIILPPMVYNYEVSPDRRYNIMPEDCISFLKTLKMNHPEMEYQKTLVNCKDKFHIKYLQKHLEAAGYKVFATCSAYGEYSGDDEDDAESIVKSKLMDKVDAYEGDCFILHIRQLTQGIDVKSITATIEYRGSHQCGDRNQEESKTNKHIQIAGRTLRPAEGEREMDIEHRTKKYGYVCYLVNQNDTDKILRTLRHIYVDYYGVDCFVSKISKSIAEKIEKECIEYGAKHSISYDSDSEYDDFFDDFIELSTCECKYVKIQMMNYIREKIKPQYDWHAKTFGRASAKAEFDNFARLAAEKAHEFELYVTSGEAFTNEKLISIAKEGLHLYCEGK